MYGTVESFDNLGLSLTDLPFIGSLFKKVQGEADKQVQRITEKVAEFKLIPNQINNLQARIANLSGRSGVTGSAVNTSTLTKASTAIMQLAQSWPNANAIVDVALEQIQAVRSGRISLGAATAIASGATTIAEALGKLSNARKLVDQIELSVLTPAERQAAAGLGLQQSLLGGGSWLLIGAAVVGGYLLLRRK